MILPEYVRLVLNEVDKTTPIGFRVDLPGKKFTSLLIQIFTWKRNINL